KHPAAAAAGEAFARGCRCSRGGGGDGGLAGASGRKAAITCDVRRAWRRATDRHGARGGGAEATATTATWRLQAHGRGNPPVRGRKSSRSRGRGDGGAVGQVSPRNPPIPPNAVDGGSVGAGASVRVLRRVRPGMTGFDGLVVPSSQAGSAPALDM